METTVRTTGFIGANDFYVPDKPRNAPVYVEQIALTYEQARKEGWHFKRKSNGRLRISRYTGEKKNVIVPSSIGGAVVNELQERAFYKTCISVLEIPSTIKKIHKQCCYMSEVKAIRIAEGLIEIPAFFAASCSRLAIVQLPTTLWRISKFAFKNCKNLEYIDIPKRCGLIEYGAFAGSCLRGFAFDGRYDISGSAFDETPLARNYAFILKNSPTTQNGFNIILRGRPAASNAFGNKNNTNRYLKLPEMNVSFGKHSVLCGYKGNCILDLSLCRRIVTNSRSFQVSISDYGPDGEWYMDKKIIVPNDTKGVYFPPFIDVVHADGRKYEGYAVVERKSEDETIVNIQGYDLPIYSLMYETRKLIVRKSNSTEPRFTEKAVISRKLEHILLSVGRGEGEIFDPICNNLHCVEWGGLEKVYIPSADTIGLNEHRVLLKAFNGKYENGMYMFFDSRFFDAMFTSQKRIDRKWHWSSYRNYIEEKGGKYLFERLSGLSQKQRIILAVDVLRSTPSLFPNREMYHKYLINHKKYAMIICDDLSQEYAEFLHDFYNCR